MSSLLTIAYGSFSGVPLLRLGGDLAFGQNVRELHDSVERLAASGYAAVVLDIESLGVTDSTGVGALLDVRRLLGERTGRVYLLRAPASLRHSLQLARVASMFVMVDDHRELAQILGEAKKERRLLQDQSHES